MIFFSPPAYLVILKKALKVLERGKIPPQHKLFPSYIWVNDVEAALSKGNLNWFVFCEYCQELL